MGKMKTLNICVSIISSIIYFVVSEEKTSMWAFVAIMSYLFYIDDKIDEKDN